MLTDPNGKRYIGRTVNFKRRMKQYTQPSRMHDSPIYEAISRYGFHEFSKDIIAVIEDDAEKINDRLNRAEKNLIALYNTVENGYNVCRSDAHSRIVKFSARTREKMRASQTGRKHSFESIAKRSGANAYQAKAVRSNTLGKIFPTLRDAAKCVGLSNGCKISECISGKRKSAGKDPNTGNSINDWEYL